MHWRGSPLSILVCAAWNVERTQADTQVGKSWLHTIWTLSRAGGRMNWIYCISTQVGVTDKGKKIVAPSFWQ